MHEILDIGAVQLPLMITTMSIGAVLLVIGVRACSSTHTDARLMLIFTFRWV